MLCIGLQSCQRYAQNGILFEHRDSKERSTMTATRGTERLLLANAVLTAALLVVVRAAAAEQDADSPSEPYPLGSSKHLFIDEFLIAEKANVTLTGQEMGTFCL
jgi:hypothetical protein